MKKDNPVFPLDINDWFGSGHVSGMTMAQRGAYHQLLLLCWGSEDFGLPHNDEELAILSGLGDEWSAGSGAVIRQCFFEKDGRLFNKRLLVEAEKIEHKREKRRRAGKASGQARRKKTPHAKSVGAETLQSQLEELRTCWNVMAKANNLPEARAWSGSTKRRKSAVQRFREPGFIESWKEAIEAIPKSDFLCGKEKPKDGRRPWKANIDFFLRPDSVNKILEGTYGGRKEDDDIGYKAGDPQVPVRTL